MSDSMSYPPSSTPPDRADLPAPAYAAAAPVPGVQGSASPGLRAGTRLLLLLVGAGGIVVLLLSLFLPVFEGPGGGVALTSQSRPVVIYTVLVILTVLGLALELAPWRVARWGLVSLMVTSTLIAGLMALLALGTRSRLDGALDITSVGAGIYFMWAAAPLFLVLAILALLALLAGRKRGRRSPEPTGAVSGYPAQSTAVPQASEWVDASSIVADGGPASWGGAGRPEAAQSSLPSPADASGAPGTAWSGRSVAAHAGQRAAAYDEAAAAQAALAHEAPTMAMQTRSGVERWAAPEPARGQAAPGAGPEPAAPGEPTSAQVAYEDAQHNQTALTQTLTTGTNQPVGSSTTAQGAAGGQPSEQPFPGPQGPQGGAPPSANSAYAAAMASQSALTQAVPAGGWREAVAQQPTSPPAPGANQAASAAPGANEAAPAAPAAAVQSYGIMGDPAGVRPHPDEAVPASGSAPEGADHPGTPAQEAHGADVNAMPTQVLPTGSRTPWRD
ncbi:MAG: hypothetical protein Q4C85_05760 [Actinomyces sp.]|uniref:hypothetical protein n=1 Tax=Actinomyces sp. TaxID=29317 RepID=UPI0026DB8A87|nr:hypothetical protein [Actinomyces sp.]MDO4243257.1 hypothetical protein [Actinomyces sp.]